MLVGSGTGWCIPTQAQVGTAADAAHARQPNGREKGVNGGKGGKGAKEWTGSDTTSAASSDVALSDAD